MNSNNYLLIDVGGTHTRVGAREDFNSDISLLHDFPTNKISLLEKLSEYSKIYDGVSIAVAGPVMNNKAKITFNNFSISIDEISPYFSKAILLNDYEAGAYGLESLTKKDYKVLIDVSNNSNRKMLFGIGTGLGISLNYDSVVFSTEGGFSTLYPSDSVALEYLDWRKEKKLTLDLHGILAGNSIADLMTFYDKKYYTWSCDLANDFFCNKHPSRQIWEELFGQSLQEKALAFIPTGGIFLSGGVVSRYIDSIDWKNVITSFKSNSYMANLLDTFPVNVLFREHMLEGCDVAIRKRFNS